MPLPPLSVDSFRNLASNCRLPDRDIVVRGANEARTVRLGNIVFTTAKATNVATMGAFKAALGPSTASSARRPSTRSSCAANTPTATPS